MAGPAKRDGFFNCRCSRKRSPRASWFRASRRRRACVLIELREIEEAFLAACREEIEAPKPGNVHISSPGHGMTAEHFFASAAAAAGRLCAPGQTVGQRIYSAVAASFAATNMN